MEKDFKQQHRHIRRIVLIGPESSGKSSLATLLARYFDTTCCEEYSRQYAMKHNRNLVLDDVLPIAIGQLNLENEAAANAVKMVICDTNPLASALYSKWYYGSVPQELNAFLDRASYDFYLLTAPDLPWEEDGIRDMLEGRATFFDQVEKELQRRQSKYAVIKGEGKGREEAAIHALQQFLNYDEG